MQVKPNAILPMQSSQDLSEKEGYFIKKDGTLVTAATDVPHGLILDGEKSGFAAVAVPGGFAGTAHVKLGPTPGTVDVGTYLVLNADGSANADTGAGARVRVAKATQAGTGDELIEAVIFDPVVFTA
ncbi:MAG: hypothetical protein LBV12_07085 [Puniceicoccales bacterium]|jgi:hypothetical protein|nr:hypothetical protein [Puniceicoccales bacterium]